MNKEKIYTLIQHYFADKPVSKVSVFGSFARGDDEKSSDIDILIEMEKPVGLFALGRYVADLEDLTQKKVDLATQNGLRKNFYSRIEKDIVVLYAK